MNIFQDLARVLRVAADECDRIASEHAREKYDWISQARSILPARVHCAAVRRRLATNTPGAAIVGRRYLLSLEAHNEELERVSKRPRKKSVADELREELEMLGKL